MALYDSLGRREANAHPMSMLVPSNGGLAALIGIGAALVDIGTIVAASFTATATYIALSGVPVDYVRSQQSALALAALFITLSLRDGSYGARSLGMPRIGGLALKWLICVGLFLIIAFLFKSGAYYSRAVLLGLTPIGFVGLASSRYVVGLVVRRAVESNRLRPARVAMIGDGETVERRLRDWLSADPSIDVSHCVTVESGETLSSRVRDVVALSQAGRIDQVLIALPWSRMTEIQEAVGLLRMQALPVLLMPDLRSVDYISRPSELGGLPVFEVKRAALNQSDLMMKRAVDLVIAFVGLVALTPLLAATAIAIKLDSPGPVFFRQRRHGFNNREFRIFKFRTMRVTEDGPVVSQATRNDPRVTRIGAFLRKSSIDELPQLINVLKGEMSIVGPRPHAIAHNEEWVKVVEGYAQRHNIPPGITGLAQVSGYRGETDTPEKLKARIQLDIRYIETWSMGLDLRIIAKTAIEIFFQKSAY